MATGYLEHWTVEGDRWDLLAWRYYGDPYGYERIIRANPEVPIIPVLPSGVRLLIPAIDSREVPDSGGLPPWM
jgi:phage tail protein X